MSTWTLREPTLGDQPLTVDYGIVVTDYNVGAPIQREDVELIPNADGEDDYTAFSGARIVVLTCRLVGDAGARQATHRRLRSYQTPARRVQLLWDTDDAVGQLQLYGRGTGLDFAPPAAMAPLVAPLTWRCSDGVLESTIEKRISVGVGGGTTQPGRTYDLTFDRTYPAGSGVSGSSIANNEGTATAVPLYRIYGPVTNPRLRNLTTGGDLNFNQNGGLVVNAGDYVEVDPGEATALTNGLALSSVLSKLDFAATVWKDLRLQPGVNAIQLDGTGTTPATRCDVIWHDPYY